MKRIVALLALFIISCTVAFTFAGCGSYLRLQETKIYSQTLNRFFDALDSGNEDALLSLFSQTARRTDTDIKDQISRLISIYPRSETTRPSDSVPLAGSYSSDEGLYISSASSLFPVISDNQYYWFFIDLTYEDDFNSENLGIRQIVFYTVDEFFIYHHYGTSFPSADGLFVYADQDLDTEIRCINQFPFEFTPVDRVLTLSMVEDHITKEKDFSRFVEKFGLPNAKDTEIVNNYYYELQFPGERFAYLEISVDDQSDQIEHASVVSDLNFIRTIFDEET